MLLIGPWRDRNSDHECIFGDTRVKAEMVQDGVLSCITPGNFPADHLPSPVTLDFQSSIKFVFSAQNGCDTYTYILG